MANPILAILVPALLVFPVTIVPYADTGVVLADLVCLAGAVVFLKRALSSEAFLVAVTLAAAMLVCLLAWVFGPQPELRPFGSFAFFFKPMFAYFAAWAWVRSPADADRFFLMFSRLAMVLLASVVLTVALGHGGVFRAESELNGSLFGLPIFGAWGVNSLAVFYALCSFVGVYALLRGDRGAWPLVHLGVAAGFGLLAFASLSREAALGLAAMGAVLTLLLAPRRPVVTLSFVLALALGAVLVLPALVGLDYMAVKVAQVVDGIASRDWDAVSSGRLSLYGAALEQVVASPVSGVAFGGFDERTTRFSFDIEVAGLSPHNQYITAVWKMGLVAGLAYFVALAMMAFKALALRDPVVRRWTIAFLVGVFVVFANLWDILIVPNVGALVFFILGVLSAASEQAHVDPDDRLHG